jgi:hypothetical protein
MRVAAKTIRVDSSERVCVDGSWSEGSRDSHECVDPRTGATLPGPELEDRFNVTAFDHRQSGGYARTAPGVAFIRTSDFRGKVYTTLVLCPEDFAALVTDRVDACQEHEDCKAHPELGRECAKRGGIGDRDLQILGTIRSYKAGDYRKQGLARLGYTLADGARLAERGYLSINKAGAVSLTATGRVAASNVRVR